MENENLKTAAGDLLFELEQLELFRETADNETVGGGITYLFGQFLTILCCQ